MAIEIRMTEQDYYDHSSSYDGVCGECGEIRFGSTEPDAEGYPCDACGARAVMGMELAMMLDVIELVDS